MILRYGDMETLKGLDWYTVELRSEKTVESTLRRIGLQLPSIFQDENGAVTPVEIFVPLTSRDLDVFELSTSNYIFARSKNFYGLLRLKTITGIVGLLTLGDSNRPSKAIPIKDVDVQGMIEEAARRFTRRADGITINSFVRILDGPTRDWCGTVISLAEGVACIRVSMKTKILLVETPVRNLRSLAHVPEELQVFYYAPILDGLLPRPAVPANGDTPAQPAEPGHVELVAEDLLFNEDPLYSDDGLKAQKPHRHGRQQTVTALVKRQIFSGVTLPLQIAKRITEALAKDEVKPPKNLSIVAGIIKRHLLQEHFARVNKDIKSYADVIKTYGADYRFSVQDIAYLGGDLTIPRKTTEPCTDGRSSEARQARKQAA